MMYQEAIIEPSPSTYGEWVCNRYDLMEPWDLYDWIVAVEGQGRRVYILGKDVLPQDIKDIRGEIHNEPPIVAAVVNRYGAISYHGLIPA
jgi:hypothetical protein